MPQIPISALPRTEFGKGAARRLRAAGRVPAVIYGSGAEVTAVSLPAHDLAMALKVAEVILKVDVAGDALSVAPRQVQKDPVRLTFEHVDLVILSAKEVRERLVVGKAVMAAEKAAAEEELEAVAVVTALRELLDEGMSPDDAISAAVEQVKEHVAAQAAAAVAAAAAEDAAEAAAAETEAGELGEAASAQAEGGSAPAAGSAESGESD